MKDQEEYLYMPACPECGIQIFIESNCPLTPEELDQKAKEKCDFCKLQNHKRQSQRP